MCNKKNGIVRCILKGSDGFPLMRSGLCIYIYTHIYSPDIDIDVCIYIHTHIFI